VRGGGLAVPDAAVREEYVSFETTLADATLALAQNLEQQGSFRCEFLYDANRTMGNTIERLHAAQYPPATQSQREALMQLIKARDDLRQAFGKSSPSEEFRRFDREQAQKLRKPESEEEQAEMLADKIRQLADEQEFVYATLGGVPCEQGSPSKTAPQLPTLNGLEQSNSQSRSAQSDQEPAGAQRQDASSKPSAEDELSREQPEQQADGEGELDRPGEGPSDEGPPDDRRDMERRQRDIAREAHDAQRMMDALRGMTELARNRMARGTRRAEEASEALAVDDPDSARQAAGEAGELFRELAGQLNGLIARDVPGRIRAARDMSAGLAEGQRDLASRMGLPSEGMSAPRGRSGEGQQDAAQAAQRGTPTAEADDASAAVGDAPRRLAERGRTLQDVLDALIGEIESDQDLTAKIAVAREDARLDLYIHQMEMLGASPGGVRLAGDATEAAQHAERLEVLTHQLDALHGAVVTPRLNQLIAWEKQAAMLRDRLDELASDAEISQWHLDSERLLEALEQAESGGAAVDALHAAMSSAGWGGTRVAWRWARVSQPRTGHNVFAAPDSYHDNLTTLVEDLQRTARELLLGDLMAGSHDAVPPQYETMVERYFEVLSRGEKRD
jgi:hypothetical protein